MRMDELARLNTQIKACQMMAQARRDKAQYEAAAIWDGLAQEYQSKKDALLERYPERKEETL